MCVDTMLRWCALKLEVADKLAAGWLILANPDISVQQNRRIIIGAGKNHAGQNWCRKKMNQLGCIRR